MKISFEININFVAWYGAIIATLGTILGLFNYLRDKGKIKVKISQGFLASSLGINDKMKIFIEAINVGRRPVTLTSAGFSFANRWQLIIPNPVNIKFPYELKEGKSVQVFCEKEELIEANKKENTEVKTAWYRDATGKIYNTKFKLKL